MNPIVADNSDEIQRLCLQFGVRCLYAFGSAVDDTFDAARSDLDFAVEFNDLPPGDRADAYFGLLHALERLFDRRIDLISYSAIQNPYFRRSVDQTKVPIYAAA